ncbi:HTH-type transcriptional activator NahR [Pseudomonas sp. IT-194MI4]|jgi:DNA-binding transcriptional LysR family regulator|uniref:DNA-binding transcriptional regulator, LysR family n=1 Tax=Pseudomonas reinekei TaxID=395598 RepID=Q0VH45_PSERE|nr:MULTISPECIES: LysR family transcriptional regulator [Pseudomonas]NBB61786.1 LysR family transcriptional regulator [Pseudomonas sp. ODNR1LW]ABH07019.1 putative LysR type regulator [Pseudomonas reinekei]KAB0488394.1 LysR family transcriptional regulator [Pseudomonas reinekei]OLU05880.1 LysR family transcriptional regulator [Pseudomonas reinekei]SDP67920.1 DNA-binding transcriptional regulator, LysR family [Pseudomonas reinekei]
MELHDLDLNLLVVFNQLLLDRRVSTAAENLGLTQPAVSNALKRLRAALGDDLFVRTYHGMQPTPYAEQLAEPVLQAMDTLRDALSRANTFDPLSSARTFTVAMTDIGEIYLIPRLMDALARLAPGCKISTVRDNAMSLNEDLQNGTVDVAIGLIPQLRAGFFQRRLMRQHYVCLCRKDHPATREPLTLERFCAYGHVRVVAANTGHGEADTLMMRLGIERSIRLEVPHFAAIGHILKHTDLVATVPERYATVNLEHFGLTALPHPVDIPEFTINMLWHARYHRDPANRWLRQLMFELFSEA